MRLLIQNFVLCGRVRPDSDIKLNKKVSDLEENVSREYPDAAGRICNWNEHSVARIYESFSDIRMMNLLRNYIGYAQNLQSAIDQGVVEQTHYL